MSTCTHRIALGLATAVASLVVTPVPATAQVVVTELAPSTNTDPGVWYESNITGDGVASIVGLTGEGGDLENNQPLPTGALRLTTGNDNGDRANAGVGEDYGTPADIFGALELTYSYYKGDTPGTNLTAAPALKLAFINFVCDEPSSAGDCFGTLVYEPSWNQPGSEGGSVDPPLDAWQTVSIDGDNGLFWWTGGFGQPNTAGGPPLRTLNQWLATLNADFADSTMFLVEVGVGSFNLNQLGYVDNVQISTGIGPSSINVAYDFEFVPEVENVDTGEQFTTLQAAIDDADTLDGHTLEMLVADHTTPELQVVFSKDLTLRAGNPGDTLRPSQDTGTSGDARGWFLVPLGQVVAFEGLTLDGTGVLVFNGIRNHGELTLTDCTFTEIKYNESGPNYSGIAVSHFQSGGAPMTVTNCHFSEIGRIGLHIFEPATVENCTYVGKGTGDFLDYFSCVDSFGASLGVAEFTGCTVSGNRGVASVDGSTSAGVLVTTFFGLGTEACFTECTFTDNTTGVFVGFNSADESEVAVNNCNIVGNDFGVVNSSTLVVVDAKDNWWGHIGGPDDPSGSEVADNDDCAPVETIINENPLGDSVTDENVCYCSWALMEQAPCPPTPDEVLVTVELQGIVDAGPFDRCIRFELFDCETGMSEIFEEVLTFVGGVGTLSIELECETGGGALVWDCITARDELHSLQRVIDDLDYDGSDYTAEFTAANDKDLLGGNINGDSFIDVLDFGATIAAGLFASADIDTDCQTLPPHADTTGDGFTDLGDVSFISVNFLELDEAGCCTESNVGQPTEEISVAKLIRGGHRDMARADLSGDGVLNVIDIVLAYAGVRPQPAVSLGDRVK